MARWFHSETILLRRFTSSFLSCILVRSFLLEALDGYLALAFKNVHTETNLQILNGNEHVDDISRQSDRYIQLFVWSTNEVCACSKIQILLCCMDDLLFTHALFTVGDSNFARSTQTSTVIFSY